MKPLRILMFSASFGAGHINAAEALIQVVKEYEPAAEIDHEDFMDLYNKVLNKFIKNSYIRLIKRAPKIWGTFYQSTQDLSCDSRFQRFVNSIGRKQLIEYIHSLKPDIIICTYPTVAGLMAELRTAGQLNVPLVTVITDYTVHSQWIHPGVDLYIVGSKEVRDGLIEKGIRAEVIQVTGIPVNPVFDKVLDKEEVRTKLGLASDRLTFLVMGGAYGVLGNAKWMCNLIATADAPIQGIVVCGMDHKFNRSLDPVVEDAVNPIVRFDFVNNVHELMTAADVIITKAGGLTVSEALAKHLPMLIFKPIPGQEENNANYIKSIGAGIVTNTQQEFLEVFHRLIANQYLIGQMSNAAAFEFPGNSAERAGKAIIDLAYKWRSANPVRTSPEVLNVG
jgi:processive 1,2-diacylglycerol beta-glucosyltransferase